MDLMSRVHSYLPDDILVPTDPVWKYRYNIFVQVFSIGLYTTLLVYVVHNIYVHLWLKKRYKVLTHTVFYTFAFCLAVGRIV